MKHSQESPTFGQFHTSANVEFLQRLWLDCVYDSETVGVCQQTHVIPWNTV